MNVSEMKTTYKGIEIAYDERDDLWRFELRGRQRSSESLAKAKEAIDKPLPDDKKPFARVKAYKSPGYGGTYAEVEITSIADTRDYRNRPDCWISNAGKREKVNSRELHVFDDANAAKIAEMNRLNKEAETLREKARELEQSLDAIDLSKFE